MNLGCSTRAACGSISGRVAGEAEPAAGILRGDGRERRAERGLQGLLRAGADRPQPGLELGPGLLDRVHVRRVGRQVAVAQAGAVERLAHLPGLVRAEVVHDHERVGPLAQRGDQDLLREGQEDGRAGRGGDAPAGDDPVERERADHGQPLPPPPGHLAHRAPPLGGAGVGAGHAGVDAGLVDEHEATGVDPGQLGAPHPPRLGHVLPVLLGGPDRLFFRTRPSAFSARHSAEGLRRTPVRSASRSAYSARVASFRSATRAASVAASPPTGLVPPRRGLGARRPSLRAILSQPESVRSPIR